MMKKVHGNRGVRVLSQRGKRVGKDGHFVGAIIGVASQIGGMIAGNAKAKKETAEAELAETEIRADEYAHLQDQQEIMDANYSDAQLQQYNPDGNNQMYVKNGARIAYPYSEKGNLTVNPTMMFNKNGRFKNYKSGGSMMDSLHGMSMADYMKYQGGGEIGRNDAVNTEGEFDENQYAPNYLGLDKNTALGNQFQGLSEAEANVIRRQQKSKNPSTGKMSTYGEVYDWMNTDDATQFYSNQQHGTIEQAREGLYKEGNKRIQGLARMGGNELPPQYEQDFINESLSLNKDSFGSSYENFKDRLPSQYYGPEGNPTFEQGGAAQVPGGQMEQVTDRAQVVNGDNPGMIDDVELGTNPGEPNAMVDHNEVIIDAKDPETGEPYKQVFSDTVMVPGTNKSMAKEAKKYLKQMPKDESSEQAQRLYQKIDELFEVQQMLNGDSQGENAQEAAAGGMDPNAAMEMDGVAFMSGGKHGRLGNQSFQYGGADYYNEGMREEMMEVPYPNAEMGAAFSDLGGDSGLAKGISGISKGISGGLSGYATGLGMGSADNAAGKAGFGLQAANNMSRDAMGLAQGISDSREQNDMARMTEEDNTRNAINDAKMTAQEFTSNEYGGKVYSDNMFHDEYSPMSMADMYAESKSFADHYESMYMPNTLADLQGSANPDGWGKISKERSNRRSSELMGRNKRPQDNTPVMSPSERDGPTPSILKMREARGFGKKMQMGGRLYYGQSPKIKSLTLTIL